MSDGLKLLSAIIRDKDIAYLLATPEVYFVEREKEVYDFIASHYKEYRDFPSSRALKREGHSLPPVEDSIDYYKDICMNRAMFTLTVSRMGDVNDALHDRKGARAIEIIKEIVADSSLYSSGGDITDARDALESLLDNYEKTKNFQIPRGIPYCYDYLTSLSGGMRNGDLVVIAARPGMGKTQVLLNMVLTAWEANKKILLVSAEMGLPDITERLAGLCTRINPKLIRDGQVGTFHEHKLYELRNTFRERSQLDIIAGDFGGKISDIESFIVQKKPDIVYIDAAYLLGAKKKYNQRHEAMSSVMEEIKSLAREYDIPIFISVQVNRKGASTKNIGTEHFAETDVIGQICSLGMIIGKTEIEEQRKITIIKSRHGEVGEPFYINFSFSPVDLSFLGVASEMQTENQTNIVNSLENLIG